MQELGQRALVLSLTRKSSWKDNNRLDYTILKYRKLYWSNLDEKLLRGLRDYEGFIIGEEF